MLLSKLEAFHNHYPHVRLKISNHSTSAGDCFLESGLVDFAIVTTPLSVQKQFQKISWVLSGNSDRRSEIQRTGFPASAHWKNLRTTLSSRWKITPAPEIFIFNTFLLTASVPSGSGSYIHRPVPGFDPAQSRYRLLSGEACRRTAQAWRNSSDPSERIPSCKTNLSCTECFQTTEHCSAKLIETLIRI